MYDCHAHCLHSADSETPIEDMVEQAIAKGLKYIAFTDHIDRDYLYGAKMCTDVPQLDIPRHIKEIAEAREHYRDRIEVRTGVECGYSVESEQDYKRILEGLPLDLVLNSVHSIGGIDCYNELYYQGLSQSEAYIKYLQAVYHSVICDYDYDVITHIGYVCRRAPYDNVRMRYSDYADLLDMILSGIIERGKTLEINAHSRGTGADFLPYTDIVDRYIELGGENFSYGSDAHRIDRVGDKSGLVREYLWSKGVKYIDIFRDRQTIKMPL